RLDEAAAVAEKLVALERELFGPAHVTVASSLGLVARLHEARGAFGPAAKARAEVLAVQARLDGRDHRPTTHRPDQLAEVQARARLEPAALRRVRRATALNARVEGLWRAGRSAEALPLALEALALFRATLGERDRATAMSLFNLGAQYQGLHRFDEAWRV